ncbi:MAG: hypothetical protein AB4041_06035 [Microcystaceae cyanobacterium]
MPKPKDENKENTQTTVQCRLITLETVLKQIWLWMYQTTELVNDLLQHIQSHPDWNDWLSQGWIPAEIIDSFVKSAKQKPPYSETPSRFSPVCPKSC